MKKIRKITAGVIMHDGKVLSLQRPLDHERSPGRWEFVGGHVEEGETFEESLIREVEEEIGCDCTIVEHILQSRYGNDEKETIVEYYLCDVNPDEIKLLEHNDMKWLTQKDLFTVDWLGTNIDVLNKIMDRIAK